ncbi:Mitochondrial transcription termination factor family protein [Thalictrum thalictroides]|uniref:Mitochondrial transcription termination factor family protein n=1 Tax=Thalictrum thalictroides TaxID=46969 RepID=A0A7J6XAM1_THATH|nr:Mitochondrial transcription termination factor family protein [Thalictrum thalictroides]
MYNYHRSFVCRIREVIHSSSRTITNHHQSLKHLLQNPSSVISIRLISTTSSDNTSKPNQFTVDYLINSCGLSPESARKASKRIVLKPSTIKRTDSVLNLFKTYGFTNSQISKLLTARSELLVINPDKYIKPKLDFYRDIGISGPVLGKLLSADSKFILSSLPNKIIPFIDFLRSIVKTNSCIARTLSKTRWGFFGAQTVMRRNISLLQDHGVPKDNISKYVLNNPRIFYVNSDQFKKMVLEVKNMGFSSSSMMFLHGLSAFLEMKKSTWDAKLAAYRSFGWSEDDILSLFKKQPNIMIASVKKINSALDFFMNGLKWTQRDVFNNPTCLFLSLERRVIPRCSVLNILVTKDLISKDSMGQALKATDDMFLKNYVTKYQLEVPELLKLYQSKMG